jgi:uncharacterized SAM-binding protein YcdF (DUF218 family)
MPSLTDASNQAQTRKRRYLLPTILALAVTLIASMVVIFFGVGRWLVVEDPLQKADAIVVFSGRMPIRAVEAARLYRQGYAPQIWLTRPLEPAASLDAMGIPNSGENFFNSRVLIYEGVPSGAIVVLEPSIDNTADEIRAVSREAARRNASNLILVTSKAHTRRVCRLWRKLSGHKIRSIIRAASEDPFDPAHWWRTSSDALDVVREILGLMNAWAGLPLRPNG